MAEIILGIDHGNGNMKGSNVDFPCGWLDILRSREDL